MFFTIRSCSFLFVKKKEKEALPSESFEFENNLTPYEIRSKAA